MERNASREHHQARYCPTTTHRHLVHQEAQGEDGGEVQDGDDVADVLSDANHSQYHYGCGCGYDYGYDCSLEAQ